MRLSLAPLLIFVAFSAREHAARSTRYSLCKYNILEAFESVLMKLAVFSQAISAC